MVRTELERYRAMLEARKIELSPKLNNREYIAIEKAADALDEVQYAVERELAISNLDRESKLLQDVLSALGRIADGSYGVCFDCDAAINRKRLDAVPWAGYCIRCQEAADRREREKDSKGRTPEFHARAA